jgi:hypothetical protein
MKIADRKAGINYFSSLSFAAHELRDMCPPSLYAAPNVTTAELPRPLNAIEGLVSPRARRVHVRSH